MHITSDKIIKRKLTNPIHCPTQGQWWSNRSTQLLQIEQWEQRGGLYSIHVSQYLTFTVTPLTITSFMRGKCCVWPGPCSRWPLLSGSGGWALRGIIPGSLPEVRRRRTNACKTDTWNEVWLVSYNKKDADNNQKLILAYQDALNNVELFD